MGKKIIFLIAGLLLVLFLAYSLSFRLKESLPRQGRTNIIGSVYTPYLKPNSIFYFLKQGEEDLEFFLTKDTLKKVKLKIIYSNKRLLECESLLNEGDNRYTKKLLAKYNNSMEEAINLANSFSNQKDHMEESTWLLQETLLDQLYFCNRWKNDSPASATNEVEKAINESHKRINTFLIESFKTGDLTSF
jgi:hypothetical protein